MTAIKKNKGRTFQCSGYPECNMTFTRSEHLARHIRKHTGERPFECTRCSRKFSRLDNLRQHKQTVHAHEKDEKDGNADLIDRLHRERNNNNHLALRSRKMLINDSTSPYLIPRAHLNKYQYQYPQQLMPIPINQMYNPSNYYNNYNMMPLIQMNPILPINPLNHSSIEEQNKVKIESLLNTKPIEELKDPDRVRLPPMDTLGIL